LLILLLVVIHSIKMKKLFFNLLLLTFSISYGQILYGGVSANLNLWLKADNNRGVSTEERAITTWVDQYTSRNDGTNVGAPTFENDNVNQINYNPTLLFSETDIGFNLPNSTLPFGDQSYS